MTKQMAHDKGSPKALHRPKTTRKCGWCERGRGAATAFCEKFHKEPNHVDWLCVSISAYSLVLQARDESPLPPTVPFAPPLAQLPVRSWRPASQRLS